MDCREIRNILKEHIEGGGDTKQLALIEEHLKSCGPCKLYAAEIRKTVETLHGLEEIEPPAWLAAKVMQKIRQERSLRKSWIARLFFPLHIKLPLEAFAALLITVAAVVIVKNMEPELRQMDVQPQAPLLKGMPAEPEKELQKPEIMKKSIQQPQRLQEAAKQKESLAGRETRELTTLNEEKPVEQYAPAPAAAPTMPAPSSSFAPSPAVSSAMRQAETGKASGMAHRDETIQRTTPAAPVSELQAKKKAIDITTITLSVRALDDAKKEIETYIAQNRGELKILDQTPSRAIMTVNLEPEQSEKFLELLSRLGTFKEDHRAFSILTATFKLIIVKQ